MKKTNQTEMLVVVNDLQLYRNCDEEALGAFLEFIKFYKDKITHIVANGDITDYEQQSKYAKTPDSYTQALDEIQSTKWFFKTLSTLLPKAEKIFVNGNHDARWENMIKDQTMGIEEWVKKPAEIFEFKALDWKEIPYGKGKWYRWHDRIFWHGLRAGAKSNIPNLELQEAGMSVTTAHINRNMYWENVDAMQRHKSGITHGGFSKNNLGFVKKAASGWSQGFGVYYWNKEVGETPYSVIMKHSHPYFIWEGRIFNGKGFKIFDGKHKIR